MMELLQQSLNRRRLIRGSAAFGGSLALGRLGRHEVAARQDAPALPSDASNLDELITFLGAMTRLDVVVEGDPEPVIVDLPSSAARDLSLDQTVTLTIPPDAIRLYT